MHGVTAYSLAALWGVQAGETLSMLDAALAQFANVPGSADALRGLGFARLSNLADRALQHTKTLMVERDGKKVSVSVPEPRFAEAIAATKAAYDLALDGDPEAAADDEEIDRLIAAARELEAKRRA